MKAIKFFTLLFLGFVINSCHYDQDETALFAVPQTKKLTDIRAAVKVRAAKNTDSEGKVYVTDQYLFYIAQEKGVHIFNNTNPAQPQNIAFIEIAGVHDVAVKGNTLFADNYVDLLVFDLSNITEIKLVQTLPNTFTYYPDYPVEAQYYAWDEYPNEGEILVGFSLERRPVPDEPYIYMMEDALANVAINAGVGVGGSYAQFQINKNALYKVDRYRLNVYNISNPSATYFDKEVYVNSWVPGELETLFKQDEYLFAGSTTGMFIIDASDEFNPIFISGFAHTTGCDPVYVYGNTAYVTVRGGNLCGAIKDQINVLDISTITNPALVSTYYTDQPMGVGFKNNILYVCSGDKGLKLFDAKNNEALELKKTYDLNVTDVIPYDSHLILVGPNKIIQMNYEADFSLTPISVLNF